MTTLYRISGEVIGIGESTRAICEANKHVLLEADMRNADLWHAKLHGAHLCGANLQHAELNGANLRMANLMSADFSFSCLSDVDFYAACMKDAMFRGARLNWNSRDLICEILRQHAFKDEHYALLGIVYFQTDLCWNEISWKEHPAKFWAMKTLTYYRQPSDGHPELLDAYAEVEDE